MSEYSPVRVAVSARSLFNLDESHEIFLRDGPDAYVAHMRAHTDSVLEPGPVLPLMRALLHLNTLVPADRPIIDPVIVSSIHPGGALRIDRSLAHHGVAVKRASFTGGSPTLPILKAYGVDLFLSRSANDVQQAVNAGIAAAQMHGFADVGHLGDDFQFKIAIDGDAVIFHDASERIYQNGGKEHGLSDFLAHETLMALEPLGEGPFAKLLYKIAAIQAGAFANGRKPFRIILVTARGGPARERVLRTFEAWKLEPDESHFLSGFKKAGIIAATGAHVFFDDQWSHVELASAVVSSGHVPWISDETASAA
ncbi:5'-nucleotidase [Rhizobium leguminosarum]|uniref:5'-nucleotidase n=1 Tax=Rhizobium leguminosarum TaxID=384 RepID=UPI002E0F54E0|nr:5'-nucleotidase [Rhizobium leguminosarum]WSH77669.1 5'-nucleotidase [Rhizobium leguminosarum]